jgi:hypothetical protein
MPVLRTKNGERRALLNLDSSIRDALLPLFDVQLNDDKTPLGRHLLEAVGLIREVWPATAEFLLDFSQIANDIRCEDGSHPIAALLRACVDAALHPTLCYAFDRNDSAYDQAFHDALSVQSNPRRVAFRLQNHDLLFWSETRARMDGLIDRLGVQRAMVTVIADLQAIGPSSMPGEDLLREHLLDLHASGVGRVVLLASSMPESQALKADTDMTIRRHEVALWEAMLRYLPWLIFGDYGIVHPHFSHLRGPGSPIPAPKARYATPSHWIVIKGHRPRKGEANQYRAIARKILAAPWFRQNDLGWGDERIRLAATTCKREFGSHGCWIGFCTQIHLAITVRQVRVAASAALNRLPTGEPF